MAKVEVYIANYCPYCTKAKALLDMKGVQYDVIDVEGDDEARMALVKRANGMRTIPQIFINDQHIGGFDDMDALNKAGDLDALLAG